jgi:spore germination protein KB
MNLEKGRISSSQLATLVTGFIFGSSLVLLPDGTAGHDAWIAGILGLGEGLLIAYIFVSLANRFKGKSFIEISNLVYGRYIGKFVSTAFLWYLFHLGSLVVNNFGQFFSTMVMPETPRLIFFLLTIFVCISAASKGIEVIARCSQVLVPITLFVLIANTLLLIGKVRFTNFFPLLEVPVKTLLLAGHRVGSFPFGETVAFLMVIISVNKSKQVLSSVRKAMMFSGCILVIVFVRNIGVLGDTIDVYIYSSYQTLKIIDIYNILTRMEAFSAISSLTMGFLKISVLLYGVSLGTAQILNLKSYKPVVVPVGLLMALLAHFHFSNIPEMLMFEREIYPFYSIPFQIGIPLLTLIVATIRGLPKQNYREQ